MFKSPLRFLIANQKHQIIRSLYFKYSKRLNCKPKEVYDVVSNVRDYKEFLPFVQDSYHQLNQDQTQGKGGFIVQWKLFNERVDCEIDMIPDQQLKANCNNDIFKKLYCEWNFSLNRYNQTDVELILDYEFKNFLYNNVSSVFNQEVSKVVMKAFEGRLAELRKQRKTEKEK